ncbi:hypothetical protein JJF66_003888 [Escherichia coli]|nr:hypothetical protein [Escherichia coli]
MNTDSSTEKLTENDLIKVSFGDAIKDKLFNKVFAYILISFLIINWKDILILMKSKDDILYTLSVTFVGGKIPLVYEGVLPPWLYHFCLPFIFGIIASIAAPIVTLCVSKLTSKIYTEIRYLDADMDQNKRKALQIKETEIIKSINDTQFNKRIMDENKNELERLLRQQKEIMAAIKLLYDDVGVIIELFKSKGVGIDSPEKLYDFVMAIKKTSLYNGDHDFNKLVADISNLFDKTEIDFSKR